MGTPFHYLIKSKTSMGQKNKSYNNKRSNVIDLHGLNRTEAFILVEDELLIRSNSGTFSLTIITGNSKPMRDGVIRICETHGFSYVVPSHNMGEIIVNYFSF